MEKVECIKKESILHTQKSKVIVGTLLLSGLGVALPRIFHVLVGSSAGATFLPMHIAVLLASLIFGGLSGSIVAGISVLCSFLLTGMPSVARLPYMAIELVIYAALLGLLNKKYNSYISLILTIVLGRVLYAGVLFISSEVFMLNLYGTQVLESVKLGMPGLVIQILLVPVVAKFIKERIK